MTDGLVGWIGADKMGGPMSRRLVETQQNVTVLDSDVGKREAARAASRRRSWSWPRASDIVVSTIPNDTALQAIAFGPDGLATRLKPGSVWSR